MSDLAAFRAQLDRASYLPGWDIDVHDTHYEGLMLRVVGTVPDSYHPGETTELGINTHLPWLLRYDQLHEFVLRRLLIVGSHEVREWFKVDGHPYSDPHKNNFSRKERR